MARRLQAVLNALFARVIMKITFLYSACAKLLVQHHTPTGTKAITWPAITLAGSPCTMLHEYVVGSKTLNIESFLMKERAGKKPPIKLEASPHPNVSTSE